MRVQMALMAESLIRLHQAWIHIEKDINGKMIQTCDFLYSVIFSARKANITTNIVTESETRGAFDGERRE